MRLTTICAVAVGLLAGTAVSAEVLSTRNRVGLFSNQTSVLDSRAAQQYNNSVRLQPPRVETPTKYGRLGGSAPAYRGSYNGIYAEMARGAARRHGIPEDLFLRLVDQESRFNPKARSHKGAIGLAQLMPGTASRLGVDPADPEQNLDGGARYLKAQYQRFRSWPLALAAYNAGPEAVVRHEGVPPYTETRNYVARIWGE